jgi:hypothetical protein
MHSDVTGCSVCVQRGSLQVGPLRFTVIAGERNKQEFSPSHSAPRKMTSSFTATEARSGTPAAGLIRLIVGSHKKPFFALCALRMVAAL